MDPSPRGTKNSSIVSRKSVKHGGPRSRRWPKASFSAYRRIDGLISRLSRLYPEKVKLMKTRRLFSKLRSIRRNSHKPSSPRLYATANGTSDSWELKQPNSSAVGDRPDSFPSKTEHHYEARERKTQVIDIEKLKSGNGDSLSIVDTTSTTKPANALKELSAGPQLDVLDVPPYSLLPPSLNLQQAIATGSQMCGVQISQVVDILPCTPLQEGLIALTEIRPENYVTEHIFQVGPDIDADLLHTAWLRTVESNAILRTRIISLPHAEGHILVQVVLDEGLWWTTINEQDPMQDSTKDVAMGLGTPLSMFILIRSARSRNSRLVWRIHHSLFDGWTLPLILKEVQSIYFDQPRLGLQPMSRFIKHLLDRDVDTECRFWTAMFENSQGIHFPPVQANRRPQPDSETVRNISDISCGNSDFTPATLLKAAWAVATANATGSGEALFGLTVTGRQAALEGIELIAGPTIATVPVAILFDWDKSINHLLEMVQGQTADMISYEHTGLQKIARMSDKTATGCNFQTLLVIQPISTESSKEEDCLFLTEVHDNKAGSTSDTYPVVIECLLSSHGVDLRVAFDSKIIAQDHMDFVIDDFVSALRRLNDSNIGHQSLQLLHGEPWDICQVFSWNETVPPPTLECIHDMISRRVLENPSRLAINAWDRDFTYEQLDIMSTRLALHVCGTGVQGKIVPLLFEKSAWMPIAAVAVMKAGAACLVLDTTQPPERLRSIMAQAEAPLVLSSIANESLSVQLGNHTTILVGPNQEWNPSVSTLPVVDPSDVLYLCFTSGSTGVPKGAMITHSNFASAITYQQIQLGYSSSTRVFNFSSYAFDPFWSHIIHSFTSGGCLCIPSQEERDNDLAGCLERYGVDHADFTPSVARIVGEKALSRLSTLLIGGEPVLPGDTFLVNGETKIFNVYGPTECTPLVAFSQIKPGAIAIGRGAGVCTWVIDPETNTPSKLGEVGELWVEGPLVGRGYLNNESATNKSFIEDPEWLTRCTSKTMGASKVHGRRGRLYRTGDMVQYRPDGSLLYVGRTDTQVKIRGQRVELGEVEQHVLLALPEGVSALVTAEVIQVKKSQSLTIVVFITLKGQDASQMTEDRHELAVADLVDGLRTRLVDRIPRFLMPTAIIPMFSPPMLASGKTDRKSLRIMGESLHHRYSKTGNVPNEPEEPLSNIERIIQQSWMSVMDLPVVDVGVNEDFTRIGGDSITAMQIVSQCKLHNIAFTVSDLLQASTIKKLASRCTVRGIEDTQNLGDEDDVAEGPFDLSPVQQMFFNAYPDGFNHWNQSFLLKLSSAVSSELLQSALNAVVCRHDMLRCRFQKDPATGHWMQQICDENDPQSFAFAEHVVQNHAEIAIHGQHRQETMNLQRGPVFACDIFRVHNREQMVLLSAHHTVVDLVSWRIILGDIEDFISHGSLISHPTMSFRAWCRRQARVGASLSPLSVLPYYVPPLQVAFWGIDQLENTFASCTAYSLKFDKSCTAKLFGDCNRPLRTEPLDILIGALAYTFVQMFPEREVATVWLEGHGREPFDESHCDVSSTVGWFTTLYPLPLPVCQNTSALHAIRLAKDFRRKVPSKGQPYFSCRYHSESGRTMFEGHEVCEITLNFTGKFQQLEKDDGLFTHANLDDGVEAITEMASTARRFALIEIEASVEHDELLVSFDVHEKMKHQERLQGWADLFHRHVESTVDQLLKSDPVLTLSDLPLLNMSYDGLDTLLNEQLPRIGISSSDVVDIYGCSTLQQGILLSAQKENASYETFSVWRLVSPPDAGVVLVPKLRQAWEDAVNHHTILQSIFTVHPETGEFIQVVLKHVKPRVTILNAGNQSPTDFLNELQRPVFAENEPNHAFTICQSSTGEVSCRLDVSHSLVDASSMFGLVRDLLYGYDGIEIPPRTPFREMIRYLSGISKTQRIATWTKLLQGLQACEFPVSLRGLTRTCTERSEVIPISASAIDGVAEFCRDVGITRSVFIQVAWSMVLSHFTGRDDVCFGYLCNGRDIPVEGVDTMVGPLANLLISRVNLRLPPKEVLQQTSQNSIKHLAIQHVSLADIQHHLGLSKRLFNTALSIRGAHKMEKDKIPNLTMEPQGGEDPHEFDIGLSALIDGDSMEVLMEYHQPYVPEHIAREAADVFTKATRYLLDAGRGDAQTNNQVTTLASNFFKQTVGQDEASTQRFWRDQFANIEASHFPSIEADVQPMIDNEVHFKISGLNFSTKAEFSAETILRGGWAIFAANMTGSNEALFGAIASNNTAQFPIRISLAPEMTVDSFLYDIQLQSRYLRRFEHTGLCRIMSTSEEAALAAQFQTIIHVEQEPATKARAQSHGHYALFVSCYINETDASLTFSHDSSILDNQQVLRLAHQWENILRQLLDPDSRITQLNGLTLVIPQDIEDIWSWNAVVPQCNEACMHDLITNRARAQPKAQAVCAWDGDLTYSQLDELSTLISLQLIRRGIGPRSYIPLLFEKSMWMPVAVVAVMKAGAATVATDTVTQPEERLRCITQTVKAPMILCSSSNRHIADRLSEKVLVVGPDLFLERLENQILPAVSPADLLYIVFTSGSTGTPKGVMVSHRNMASALKHQSKALGYQSDSRVLDFSSYAFDVFWSNMMNTLTTGACLCIPSTEERQCDLSGALEKYNITLADLTPSVARHLTGLQRLSTMILGGEVVLRSDRQLAGQNTTVFGAYGPAECTPTATILNLSEAIGGGLGYGAGVCTWIVDPDNESKLVPVGAPGELWVEGPLVGDGYVFDEEMTSKSFIQDPEWLVRGIPDKRPGRRGRLYRTGDLVQYLPDGSLQFLGRKDTQVKLRGQRIELEEVEKAVRSTLLSRDSTPGNVEVVVEVIQSRETGQSLLIAFISLKTYEEDHDVAAKRATAGLDEHLSRILPSYMIPSVFIPQKVIQRTHTGKVDRKLLRKNGSELTSRQMAEFSNMHQERRPPSTEAEELILKLWVEAINVNADNVGIDDNFFRIGGDSIGAIKVVGLARQNGISGMTVKDVFKNPILRDLASLCDVGRVKGACERFQMKGSKTSTNQDVR